MRCFLARPLRWNPYPDQRYCHVLWLGDNFPYSSLDLFITHSKKKKYDSIYHQIRKIIQREKQSSAISSYLQSNGVKASGLLKEFPNLLGIVFFLEFSSFWCSAWSIFSVVFEISYRIFLLCMFVLFFPECRSQKLLYMFSHCIFVDKFLRELESVERW